MAFIRKLKRGDHTYLVEVESYRDEAGKVKQRYLRYVGKEADNKRILTGSIADAQVTKVSVYGPLLALHQIAREIDLAGILGKYAPELLSLVYAHCVQPGSVTRISDWYERTDLNHLLSFESLTEKRLLEAMDYYDEKRREATQHNIFIRLQDTYEIKCTGIFYDITDIYFYGKECSLAKIGHNSDGMTLPQLQLGLAVTRKESFPIFHRTFPGNIHDSKTVTDIMLAFKSYGIRDVTITWDRGVSSKINIEEVQQLGADVICGLSLSKSLKKIIDKHKDIISIHNRIQLKNTALYAIEQPHTIGTVKGTLLICHNPQMKQTLRDERHKRILEARDARTTKGTPIPTPLKKYFQKNGLNERTITESEKYDGISTLFSTKKLSKEETIKTYFEKDKIEKAFRTLKGITRIRPIRHWLEQRVKTHIFICYLSYLLLSIVDYKLKQANLTISAAEALHKLHTVYKVHLTDPKSKNTFEKIVTYTKEHKEILRAIDPALLKL